MKFENNAGFPANDDPRPVTTTSAHLSRHFGKQHTSICTAVIGAAKRLGRPVPATVRFTACDGVKSVKAFEIDGELLREMARGMELRGRLADAARYREIADGLDRGVELAVDAVELEDGRLAAPCDEAKAEAQRKSEAKKAERVGLLPVATRGRDGVLRVTHIQVTDFTGSNSGDLRWSIDKLPEAVLGDHVVAGEVERRRRGGNVEMIDGRWLDAVALEALAGNFAKSGNATGRAREGALREIAAALREGTVEVRGEEAVKAQVEARAA